MSLAAFTNEVGAHHLRSFIADKTVYHDYMLSSPPGDPQYSLRTVENVQNVNIAFSDKPPIYKSPGHAPSDYWRTIAEVTDNRPQRQTVKVWNNFGKYYETWRDTERYIAPNWHIPFSWDPVSDLGGNSIDASVTKALNKIQSVDFSDENKTVNFQGGNALVEARETGRMLAKSAIKLVKVIKAARGGHWATVCDTLGISRRTFIPGKTVSENWLEIQYGWKPLLKDIYDLDNTVRHRLSRPNQIRVSAYEHEDWAFSFGRNEYAYDVTAKERSKTTFLATLTNEFAAELQSFGVINPLGMAWEAVPFSFVVDWFVPISNTFEALTSTAGFRNDGGWTSVRRNYEMNIRHVVPESGNVLLDPGHYQERGFGFIRFAYAEWPLARLYANPKPWSTPHALNALALLSQIRN